MPDSKYIFHVYHIYVNNSCLFISQAGMETGICAFSSGICGRKKLAVAIPPCSNKVQP